MTGVDGLARSRDVAAAAAAGASRRRLRRDARVVAMFAGLAVAIVIAALVSAAIGQYHLPLGAVADSVLHGLSGPLHLGAPIPDPFGEATLWQVRLPRIVMALLVGAALSCSGALLQGVFGNPLADPGVIGVSSGAALGASIAIVTGVGALGSFAIAGSAFTMGLAATVLIYALSRGSSRTETVTLVLTGIAVNAVCGAGVALCTYLGTQAQLDQIVFWQLGSLNGSQWGYVVTMLPLAAVGMIGAFALSRRLDLLALGDRSARHLGVDVERLRLVAIILAAATVAAAVAFSGIIAFVGLVVPHLLRAIVGPGHRVLLPMSALGGALLLVVADTVARNAIANVDLPIGMLTTFVGGPFFLWQLRRTRARAGGWA
ncbi:MAG TPA: iron ABC transporter permease [Gryllotalpicola sp.]